MLMKPDCVPCISKMSISAIRKLTSDEDTIKEFFCKILEIPPLRGLYWNITSAEVIEMVMEEMTGIMGDPDPSTR